VSDAVLDACSREEEEEEEEFRLEVPDRLRCSAWTPSTSFFSSLLSLFHSSSISPPLYLPPIATAMPSPGSRGGPAMSNSDHLDTDWGNLISPDKSPTPQLEHLCLGLAQLIVS
jgi:hypothetical protein